jgi:hypothetical protein
VDESTTDYFTLYCQVSEYLTCTLCLTGINYDLFRYTARYWHCAPEVFLLYWRNTLRSKNFNIYKGIVSTVITQDGLLRFPTTPNGKPLADEFLAFLSKKRSWETELESLESMDIENVSGQAYTHI